MPNLLLFENHWVDGLPLIVIIGMKNRGLGKSPLRTISNMDTRPITSFNSQLEVI